MTGQIATARRHSVRVWLLWALGSVAVLSVSFVLADPGLLVLAIDPELIALMVLSSIALMRISAPGLFVSACAATLVRGASTIGAKLTGRRRKPRRPASSTGLTPDVSPRPRARPPRTRGR